MTDPPPRRWTLEQVRALTPEQVLALSVPDLAAALKVAQHEGTPADPATYREQPLPPGTARVYLRARGSPRS